MLTEVNVDSLVGPTHHFGGLGVGNVASLEHGHTVSHPQQAALEGLAKAWLVASLGVPQFLWMPPLRPRMDLLAHVGFRGSMMQQLREARQHSPRLLSATMSSAFMWTANAATVTPAVDSRDQLAFITPANLISSWHRAAEPSERMIDLERLCGGVDGLEINHPLPGLVPLRDEGAANHMRLSDPSGMHGLNVFVYGDDDRGNLTPGRFPARQTRAACESLARLHSLHEDRTVFLQQHPSAIDAGVFHNDVIATSHEDLLIYHEMAFCESESTVQAIEREFLKLTGQPLKTVVIAERDLPLSAAVNSYFFNSQIITPRGKGEQPRMAMLCPAQCETEPHVQRLIQRLLADPAVPIEQVHYLQLGESMANGGGPACLRLRLPLPSEQVHRLNPQLRLDAGLRDRLEEVIRRWYPTQLSIDDLAQQEFIAQAEQAVHAASMACVA